MSGKIIFPTDFSDVSDAALEQATSLARERDATLLITHVVEPPPALAASGGFGAVGDFYSETEEKQLDAVTPPSPDVDFEHRLISGDPATSIIKLATDENADLVVMSTHGRTGLMHLLMGSVAETVVRRSPCPVLTLRRPEPAKV